MSNKSWVIIFGGILLASAVAALVIWHVQVPASHAKIYKDNTLTEVVNLVAVTEPFNIVVPDYNLLEVEQGRIRVSEANCSDGTCIRQGWKSGGIMPIVCLPNRLVVVFESGELTNGVDAVVG